MKSDFSNLANFVSENELNKYLNDAVENLKLINSGKGKGSDFLGWINLPQAYDHEDIENIINISDNFSTLDAVVVIGIGGSYLGSKAVIEALKPNFENTEPEIIFAGFQLSGAYHSQLLDYLKDKRFGLVVISKSGTTLEPAIAFRVLYDEMMQRFSKDEIKSKIIIITDENKGALRELADKEDLISYIIPDNVGGRFSIFSPVGILPIAIAGYDIEEFLRGASIAQDVCLELSLDNPAVKYAAIRKLLYDKDYKLELLVNYNVNLNYIAEWWKQLFAESEGKEGKGLFTASASFTSDLHSLGQYIQEGQRILFETQLVVNENEEDLKIPYIDSDFDNLNYLAGKSLAFVNQKAFEGTLKAHVDGKVPNVVFSINNIDEYNLGFLFYFFEISCGISAYMLGVNPFNQPGVEEYKKNMIQLLNKINKN